jgi:hypothetical protein
MHFGRTSRVGVQQSVTVGDFRQGEVEEAPWALPVPHAVHKTEKGGEPRVFVRRGSPASQPESGGNQCPLVGAT